MDWLRSAAVAQTNIDLEVPASTKDNTVVKHDPGRRAYRVKYRDEDGKKKTKDFSYKEDGDDKDLALQAAKAFSVSKA